MTMKKNNIPNFRNIRVLVIGDLILDLYVHGSVDRISPEAPVPVVAEQSRSYALGGAGNVARNVASLGGRTTLVGVVGSDGEGKVIRKLCRESGITSRIVTDFNRPTSLKMRAVAMRHQLLRIDRETTDPISKKAEAELLRLIKKLPDYDFVVISDYIKGTMTSHVVMALRSRFGGERIVADVKPPSVEKYRGVYALTPNISEAYAISGIYPNTAGSAGRAARKISSLFEASVAITRGEHGMTVYDKSSETLTHVPAKPVHIFDVTGAGDTAVAAFALMLASGSGLHDAAEVANHAAGIVVGMEGTSCVTPRELKATFIKEVKRV